VDEMLATADELMYEAKADGGDAVRAVEVTSPVGGPRSARVIAFAPGQRA
jgi:hypothetical protein